jgi:hypothetical protein
MLWKRRRNEKMVDFFTKEIKMQMVKEGQKIK